MLLSDNGSLSCLVWEAASASFPTALRTVIAPGQEVELLPHLSSVTTVPCATAPETVARALAGPGAEPWSRCYWILSSKVQASQLSN